MKGLHALIVSLFVANIVLLRRFHALQEDLMVETIAPARALTWPPKGVNQDSEFTLAPSTCPAGTRWDLTGFNRADVGSPCPAWAATAAKEQLRSPWLLSVIRSAGDAGRFCLNNILGGFHQQPAGAAQCLNMEQVA